MNTPTLAVIIAAIALLASVALHAYLSPYHSCVRVYASDTAEKNAHYQCRYVRN